jgi:hypothetical protein
LLVPNPFVFCSCCSRFYWQKRRDKINQRMKTLQKLVPSSSKVRKVSSVTFQCITKKLFKFYPCAFMALHHYILYTYQSCLIINMHPLVKSGNSHQLLWSVLGFFFLKKKTIMVRLFPSQGSIIHRDDQVTSRLLQNKRVKIGLLPEKKKKII